MKYPKPSWPKDISKLLATTAMTEIAREMLTEARGLLATSTKQVYADGTTVTESTETIVLQPLELSAADKLFLHNEYCKISESAVPPRTDAHIHRFIGHLMTGELAEHLKRMGTGFLDNDEAHNRRITYSYAMTVFNWLKTQREGWDEPDLMTLDRVLLRETVRAACAQFQLHTITHGLDSMRVNISGSRAYLWVELPEDGHLLIVGTDTKIELANPDAIEKLGWALVKRLHGRAIKYLAKLRHKLKVAACQVRRCEVRLGGSMPYTAAKRTVGAHRIYPYQKVLEGRPRQFAVEALAKGTPSVEALSEELIETLLLRAIQRADGKTESSTHGVRVVLKPLVQGGTT